MKPVHSISETQSAAVSKHSSGPSTLPFDHSIHRYVHVYTPIVIIVVYVGSGMVDEGNTYKNTVLEAIIPEFPNAIFSCLGFGN